MTHNEIVHRDMVDLTYQLTLISNQPVRLQAKSALFAIPEGADPNEWQTFLAAVRSAQVLPKLASRGQQLRRIL